MPSLQEPAPCPVVQVFAGELTAWREESGCTKAELARLLGYTAQYVGQVEECKNRPSAKFALDCDTFFKTNGSFHRMWKKLQELRQLDILPPGFPEYLEREQQAAMIKIFSPLLVHGLFQNEEATRAIIADASNTEIAAELADRRLERQQLIHGSGDPPQIFLTLDEGALRRVVGGTDVHRSQLQHLIAMANRPYVSIQVVPWDCGYYPGLAGGFTTLTFPDGTKAAYTESSGVGLLIHRPLQVTAYDIRYELIKRFARSASDSLNMIKAIMEGL